jgi:hypothetical protein
MTFPASPNNGVTATVNGISYIYNAARNTWTRSPTTIGDLQPNLGTATTNITTLFSNATAQATTLNTIAANVGAFQSYANTKIGTNTNSNLVVAAATTSISTTTGALVVKGGMGVAGNVYANTIYTTTGIVWAGNGAAFSSGAEFTAGTTPPVSPIAGQQWYDTTDDILYEFIENYWVDIQSPTAQSSDYTINIISVGNITTSNIYADRFFYSNGTAFSSSNYGNTEVAAYLVANPQGSTYGNTNVEAYLGAHLGSVTTNITTQATSINTVNANVGAFQTYANATFNYGNTQVASYLTSNVSGLATRTDALTVPVGTTAQRPATTSNGAIRYNSTLGSIEGYLPSGGWTAILSDSYQIEFLVVAGGGGGGLHSGGGGGAGGLLYYGNEAAKSPNGTALTVTPLQTYTVTIGAGGNGSGGPYQSVAGGGYTGSNSSFSNYVALGGGGGGSGGNSVAGLAGGSGGGGGRTQLYGAGTSGQGNRGGYPNTGSPSYPGGGGGGAGAVGADGTTSAGGAGGVGLAYSISGTATYYAGGGGGNLQDSANSVPTQGAGGLGGGGAGANASTGNSGAPNTGGGGGGNNYSTNGGGSGGSGVVIVRYTGAQRGAGGVVTSGGGYTVHTFTGSGTFTA